MISKIRIQNYKCWVDREIEFAPITILAGGNAVGKSSIVQSILLAKKTHENFSEGEFVSTNVNSINLGVPKDIIARDRSSEEIIIRYTLKNDTSEDVKLMVGDELTQPLSFIIDKSIELRLAKDVFSNFQYLNAERVGPRISSELSSTSVLNVGDKGEYTNHVIHKADLLKYEVASELQISALPKFSAICESWLDAIIPGTQLNVSMHEQVNQATIKYKNTGTSSDAYVPTATGFGITYVLPIIVSGLILSSSDNAVLIIENPEAHLHPYGQSKIGRFLALLSTQGVQVIVETHSEHVINGARLQLAESKQTENMIVNFFNLNNGNLEVEQIDVNQKGELDKWPVGFFDQNKSDLKDLLRLRL